MIRHKTIKGQRRLNEHERALRAFDAFLDRHWQLWRQHEGSTRHHDLRAAYLAGFKDRSGGRK